MLAETKPQFMTWTVVADCGSGDIEISDGKIVYCDLSDEDDWNGNDHTLSYRARATFAVVSGEVPNIEIDIGKEPSAG